MDASCSPADDNRMRPPVLLDTKCRLLRTQSAVLGEAAAEMRRNAKALRAEAKKKQLAAREARAGPLKPRKYPPAAAR